MKKLIALVMMVLSFGALANTQAPASFIPVLMYHQFTEPASNENISVAKFREQMKWLKDNGYHTITVSQVAAYMTVRGAIPDKTVAITVDDGFKTVMDAAAVLSANKQAATFYLLSGTFKHPLYVDEAQTRELAANPLFEIGAHSHTHFMAWHKDLSQLETTTMVGEISMSKAILERTIGKPIKTFAWPFGYVRQEVVDMISSMGFTSTVTVNGITHNSKDPSALKIQRINISGRCSLDQFKSMVTTGRWESCNEEAVGVAEKPVH